METFRMIGGIIGSNFMKWRKNATMISAGFLFAALILTYLWKVPGFCMERNLTCTPFLITILFTGGLISNGSFKVLFFFIAAMVFSKAPFLDSHSIFQIVRTGRNRWMIGEVLYIILLALIMVCLLNFSCLLLSLPCLEKDIHSWGNLPVLTMTDRTVRAEYGVMNGLVFDPNLIVRTDPFYASLYTTLFVFFDLVIIGLSVYVGNLFVPKKNLGLFLALFIILIDPVIYALTGEPNRFLQVFSPVSFSSLSYYKALGNWGVLSVNLSVILSTVWIVVLLILIYIKTRKMDIVIYDAD